MPSRSSEHEPCCPEFDPARWDSTTLVWENRPFIKESMPVFFHIPWPPMIGRLLGRMWEKVQKADAAPEMKDVLVLATDPSPWRTQWYMSVTRNVPGAENVTLSGTFFTRVFDGPYNAVPKWIKEMDACLAKEDKKATKYYFHYTTCPKCAKLRGHNYVVAFAQIHPSTNDAAS
ncbi:MAG: hydrolase [Patescibacteria group bacterium]|nr:hydrolase [Patescibacteria group bacterium]